VQNNLAHTRKSGGISYAALDQKGVCEEGKGQLYKKLVTENSFYTFDDLRGRNNFVLYFVAVQRGWTPSEIETKERQVVHPEDQSAQQPGGQKPKHILAVNSPKGEERLEAWS
jgi:hypothetical protein